MLTIKILFKMPLASPMTECTDGVYSWKSMVQEFYTSKASIHTVADAISYLAYSPAPINRESWMAFTQCWCDYASHTTTQQPAIHQDSMNVVFVNSSKEDIIYPLMV
jgi:hypothetical protein